jgi:hypothetical protein
MYVSAMPGDYKVWIDELKCENITDGLGSDEVGIIVFGSEVEPNGGVNTWQKVEDEFNNSELNEVDSGDKVKFSDFYLLGSESSFKRVGTDILLSNIYIHGYEIDDGDVYENQISKAWKVYQNMWVNISSSVLFSLSVGLPATGTFLKWISSLKGGLLGFALTILKTIFTFFISAWAPPDPIIKDILNLSPSNLDYLTHPKTQIPMDSHYSIDDIDVHVQPQSNKVVDAKKGCVEYTEQRKYKSREEGSTYWLTIKYRREIS